MRNFIVNRNARYQDLPGNLGTERCREKIDAIIDDPTGYKVSDEYNHDDVRELLRKHFGTKCIYCEASPIATSTFRIDHYRPKKNIKDYPNHTGYYWLAYEWTNLFQTCQLCNGVKSNFFPLKNGSTHVNNSNSKIMREKFRNPTIKPLCDEQRLLLNPELDDVESHFSFNLDGTISSNTEEGKESIKRYGLERDDLVLSRKKIRDEYFTDIKEALVEYENNLQKNGSGNAKDIFFGILNEKFRKFLTAYKNRDEFSLFKFYMFDKFEDFFVLDIVIKEYQDLLLEGYNSYRKFA